MSVQSFAEKLLPKINDRFVLSEEESCYGLICPLDDEDLFDIYIEDNGTFSVVINDEPNTNPSFPSLMDAKMEVARLISRKIRDSVALLRAAEKEGILAI